MKTIDFPLSRITVFYVFGILLGYYLDFSVLTIVVVSFAFFLSLTLLSIAVCKKGISVRSVDIGLCLFSVFAGVATSVLHNEYRQSSHYTHYCADPDSVHNVELRLEEKLKNSPFQHRYLATLQRLDEQTVTGKVIVTIQRDSSYFEPSIGTHLKTRTKIIRHSRVKNPGQFDYGKYLDRKYVAAQLYLSKSDLQMSSQPDHSVRHYAASLRQKISKNLQRNKFKDEELNIVMALILGQQQDISKEILQDYQFAGAVHILSVSGLHVGFILLFINFLLYRIPKNRAGNLFRFITTITGLWMFAILAGLAPSVIRSATMFSFVAVGLFLKRDSDIMHQLLISMLCILALEPEFLFDVGFQLSYISLFFILWLQPSLAKLWTPSNKAIQYIWNLTTVSFAAQIGAFPLSVYYFHQFPGLFFLTNLLILPWLGLVMGLGVFVMALAAFDYVPKIPMLALEKSVTFLNITIEWIASFEQFIFDGIPLTFGTMLLLYGCIVSLTVYFQKKSFIRLFTFLTMIIILQSNLLLSKRDSQLQSEAIIFHLRNNTLIAHRENSRVTFYGSSENRKQINNVVNTYLLETKNPKNTFTKLRNTYYLQGKKVLLMDSLPAFPIDASPDILVVTQSPKINLDRLLKAGKPGMIVADGSNFKSYVLRWQQTCRKQKIPFHSTYEKGYFRIK